MHTRHRKAVSALVSYALYIGIGMSAISLALTTATPYIEDARDTASVQNQMETFTALADRIEEVAQMAEGSQTTQTLQVDRGQVLLEDDALIYQLQTGSGIISAGSRQDLGAITLSANARASLTETRYNGTECYRLENDHIETCITATGTENGFEQGSLEDIMLYLHNKRQNETLSPRLDLMLDTPTTATGRIYTTPITQGKRLGTAHLAVLVSPDDRPTYTAHIKLRSGSDYLQVSVE